MCEDARADAPLSDPSGTTGATLDSGVPAMWLVGCHGPGEHNVERDGCAYANLSDPGHVWRMNATRYDAAHPERHEADPPGRLSTFGPAVRALADQVRADGVGRAVFVCLWHMVRWTWTGRPPAGMGGFFAGLIHSTDVAAMTMDVTAMTDPAAIPNWDDRLFPFGWSARNDNAHYRAAVEAIRGLDMVQQVHLYGCGSAQDLNFEPLREFAIDVGKEVWAYTDKLFMIRMGTRRRPTGFTFRAIREGEESVARPGVIGTRESGYDQVDLEICRGLMPGWQMRAYPQGGEYWVDCFVNVMSPEVETYRPGALEPITTAVRLPTSSGSIF